MNSPMVEGPRSRPWIRRPGSVIAALVVVALIVRVGVVAATPAFTPATDAADYDRHALSIARGNGYPPTEIAGAGGASAFRPPALPYTLGALYAVTGARGERARWTAARLAEAALGAVLVGLIALLALALWGAAPAVAAAAIAGSRAEEPER